MKNMITIIAAMGIMLSAAPVNAFCAADTAAVSVTAEADTIDIMSFAGKWAHQVSKGNTTVDMSAKNIGTVEINADASYKYTDAEGKTFTGTVKLGSENIGGTEFTVLSFYEGASLKFTASYSESRPDVLSLGNGGLAQFARDTALSVPVAYSLGDINNDNAVNAVDASKVLSYYAMTSTNKEGGFTDAQKKAADVNGDGYVNSVDASNILACYAYNSTSHSKVLSFEEYRTASTKA